MKDIVRKWLLGHKNREMLIFLSFLSLSGVFWLILTLNDTFEQELRIPVRYADVPQDVVLTSQETDTLRVTVSDKGLALVSYLYGQVLKEINVPFTNYDRQNGTGSVGANDLKRIVASKLMATTHLLAIKPERLDFTYNNGESRRVPVHWSGRVVPEKLYFISDVRYTPDSVTVYASPEMLDSISTVYTMPMNYTGIQDSLHVEATLKRIPGAKIVPDRVGVTFTTDVLTEVSIDDIPIHGINLPEGKQLRFFPARVTVKFVAGVSVYRKLSASDFAVVADYNELRDSESEKCLIYLNRVPKGISRATLSLTHVDYLIEEGNPTE
jgi:hypothetical protein